MLGHFLNWLFDWIYLLFMVFPGMIIAGVVFFAVGCRMKDKAESMESEERKPRNILVVIGSALLAIPVFVYAMLFLIFTASVIKEILF